MSGDFPVHSRCRAARRARWNREGCAREELGGSVELVLDGLAGPYPALNTPGEIAMQLSPGPYTFTYRRGTQVFGGNIPGDPFDTLQHLGPRETAVITAIDPPWACIAAPGAQFAGVR